MYIYTTPLRPPSPEPTAGPDAGHRHRAPTPTPGPTRPPGRAAASLRRLLPRRLLRPHWDQRLPRVPALRIRTRPPMEWPSGTESVNHLTFPVYWRRSPSGWFFHRVRASTTTPPNAGWVWATYKSSKGAQIMIQEGAYCTTSCSPGTAGGRRPASPIKRASSTPWPVAASPSTSNPVLPRPTRYRDEYQPGDLRQLRQEHVHGSAKSPDPVAGPFRAPAPGP